MGRFLLNECVEEREGMKSEMEGGGIAKASNKLKQERTKEIPPHLGNSEEQFSTSLVGKISLSKIPTAKRKGQKETN